MSAIVDPNRIYGPLVDPNYQLRSIEEQDIARRIQEMAMAQQMQAKQASVALPPVLAVSPTPKLTVDFDLGRHCKEILDLLNPEK